MHNNKGKWEKWNKGIAKQEVLVLVQDNNHTVHEFRPDCVPMNIFSNLADCLLVKSIFLFSSQNKIRTTISYSSHLLSTYRQVSLGYAINKYIT